MKAIFEAINNIFSFVTPVSDFLWDFPKNFEWYSKIPLLGDLSLAIIVFRTFLQFQTGICSSDTF